MIPRKLKPQRDYEVKNAALLGGVFVPLPLPARTDGDALISRISDVMRETAEAIEKSRTSWLEDDTPVRITSREGAVCLADIDETLVTLVQLDLWIDNLIQTNS